MSSRYWITKQSETSTAKGEPITTPSVIPDAPKSAAFANSSAVRILLAEDGKVNRLVAVQVLQKMGYSADVANDGLEAVEAWLRHKYEIILMDCHMPNMDGYEATRKFANWKEN
jgi:PleD family two-component response regulator